jgi:hypothetical protein
MSDPVESGARESMNRWLRLPPRPRPRPPGIKWDVFVSYRSVNRTWALALYDSLREAGFEVFLDQFVLPAGVELEGFLRDNLRMSASGIVVWSGDAASSGFVRGELAVMRNLRRESSSFHYVLARLDTQDLPFLEQTDLFVDFAQYPEGPRGGELLRLMFGLVGLPLSDEAAREIHDLNVATTKLVRTIEAAKGIGKPERLLEIAGERSPALVTTSLPYAVLAEALIQMGAYEEALQVLGEARKPFSEALRLQQLEALAHRRNGRVEDAQMILNQLYEGGHRDPETVGILAATWMQRFKNEPKRIYLERSQGLYAEAFRLAPDSYYNGINAAAKAALLNRADEARKLAGQVLPLVAMHEDGRDYWATATHAEARLLHGEYAEAARLYRAAVVAHLTETGSIDTTKAQAADLLAALTADDSTKADVLAAFSLD